MIVWQLGGNDVRSYHTECKNGILCHSLRSENVLKRTFLRNCCCES